MPENDVLTDESSPTPKVQWPQPGVPTRVMRNPNGAARRNNRISLLLVAALVGGAAGHFASSNSPTVNFQTSNASPGAAVLSSGLSVPQLVKKVEPSIVSVNVSSSVGGDQGTGMIISSNGLVLTNNHVISSAVQGAKITVTRSGTTTALSATLIGTDPSDDVALIRIDNAHGLPTVTFGDSNKLVVGDTLIAIGNALGLSAGTPTVTMGIVSALGRTVTATSGTNSETLHSMIQTDAAINPGNSGGPLLDSRGHVIGMNTAVAGTLPDGSNAQNIGFAIPISRVHSLIAGLLKGGVLASARAFLGVEIISNDPTVAQTYGLGISYGAVVVVVDSGTAADIAGLQEGDIITNIGGYAVATGQDVQKALAHFRPGSRVKITLYRGSAVTSLTATLGMKGL